MEWAGGLRSGGGEGGGGGLLGFDRGSSLTRGDGGIDHIKRIAEFILNVKYLLTQLIRCN